MLYTHFLQNLPLIGWLIDVFFFNLLVDGPMMYGHSELYITGGDQHIASIELNPVIFIWSKTRCQKQCQMNEGQPGRCFLVMVFKLNPYFLLRPISRWCFFKIMFIPILGPGRFPIWLILFKWVETTPTSLLFVQTNFVSWSFQSPKSKKSLSPKMMLSKAGWKKSFSPVEIW